MTLSIPLLQLQVHIEITLRSDEAPAPAPAPQHNWDEVRQQQVFHLLYGAAPPRR